jgi:hypothetical protein
MKMAKITEHTQEYFINEIYEATETISHTVTTYAKIKAMWDAGLLVVNEEYQRERRASAKWMSEYITSGFQNKVSSCVYLRLRDDGKFEILDGQQRFKVMRAGEKIDIVTPPGNDTSNRGGFFGCAIDLSNDGSILAVASVIRGRERVDTFELHYYDDISPSNPTAKYISNLATYPRSISYGSSYAINIGQIDNFTSQGEGTNFTKQVDVSLSDDGNILAIGDYNAIVNDSNGNKISSAGRVRIFQYVPASSTVRASSWVQLGSDINGKAINEFSGLSISLSGDGKTVAIGAHQNNDTRIAAGNVRVYQYDGSDWNQVGEDIVGRITYAELGEQVSMSSDAMVLAVTENGTSSVNIYVREGVELPVASDRYGI